MDDDFLNEPRFCYIFGMINHFLLGCTLDTGILILGYFYISTGACLLILFLLIVSGALDFLEGLEKFILVLSGILWIIFVNTGVLAFLARINEKYCRLFLLNYKILWIIEFIIHVSYFIYMCGWYNPDFDELKIRNRPSIIAISAIKSILIIAL